MKRFMHLGAIILLFTPGMGRSQADISEDPRLLHENPVDAKRFSKYKFDATHADLDSLKRERLKAARTWQDARFKEFLAGRGTLLFLLEGVQAVLKSELALHPAGDQAVAALERNWSILRSIEEVNRGRSDAGRIPYKEYRLCTYYRIDAEQRLRAARRGK